MHMERFVGDCRLQIDMMGESSRGGKQQGIKCNESLNKVRRGGMKESESDRVRKGR